MKRQARRSGLVMGLGAHMIAGSRAYSTSTPGQRRYPAIKTNQHYAEALAPHPPRSAASYRAPLVVCGGP